MINNTLISVIIPVYNVEPYLHKCINSVLNQTFQNFELILVDDGSTDNSGIICDEYAHKDERIKVIHQKNAGQSAARNNGFEISKGEYICFLDSDDWFSDNALEIFYNLVKNNNVDMGMIKIVSTSDENIAFYGTNKTIIMPLNDCLNNILKDPSLYSSPCNKIFKRDLINKLKFPEGRVYEDHYIYVDRLCQVKEIGYSLNACLFYRQRFDSTTHDQFSPKKLQYLEALEQVNQKLLSLNRKDLYYKHSNKLLNCYMDYCIKLKDSNIKEQDYYIKEIKIKAKKLFKKIPFYQWKSYVIKRFFIFILSLNLYKKLIFKDDK